MNLAAGWLRYLARILLTGILNRLLAKRIEDEHMDAFEEKNGRLPRGNQAEELQEVMQQRRAS